MNRLKLGQKIKPLGLSCLRGNPVRIPDPDQAVHLQFRRFAGCPICNLHLRSITQRHDEIAAAGIREIVVFHSSADEMLAYQHELPFTVIADPAKLLYTKFGVQSSPRAVLDPRSWIAGLRGIWGRNPLDSLRAEGGRLGLPADFLIAEDGLILALNYGRHAADQWSVETLLAINKAGRKGG